MIWFFLGLLFLGLLYFLLQRARDAEPEQLIRALSAVATVVLGVLALGLLMTGRAVAASAVGLASLGTFRRALGAKPATGPSGQSSTTHDALGRDEALDILGLEDGASDREIEESHRRMIKSLHPDHGGSSYLAARVNAARDRLLGTGRK